jgi:superfamily II DNA or RNA helicase
MNAFLSATRQISNIPGKFNLSSSIKDAPKINRAYEEIAKRYKSDPRYAGVSYSNYINSGISPLNDLLIKNKIPSAMFTGKTSDKNKKQIVYDYNHGKIKQLLISGAGGEGLDLKNTKLLQIMEPHWNDATLNQVRGRVNRWQSHASLPENERKVEIQNYIARPMQRGFIFKHRPMGTDEYLEQVSDRKTALNNQFLTALQEVGS